MIVLARIREWDVSLTGALEQIDRWVAEMPDHEIYMDGELYAIVAVPREVTV